MIQGKKVRLYATKEQEQKLWQSVGTARFIYNWTLAKQEENKDNIQVNMKKIKKERSMSKPRTSQNLIGRKLKSLRLKKHITQRQVAERIGVSTAMISSYELNSRCPSYEILMDFVRKKLI